MHLRRLLIFVFSLSMVNGRLALPQNLEEEFCTEERIKICANNNLSVGFGNDQGNVFQYGTFSPGLRVPMVVYMDTADGVVGWSYAVAHDENVMSLTDDDLTLEGTSVTDVRFVVNRIVDGGFFSAIELALLFPGRATLPSGRNSLMKAAYSLNADVGTRGTLIQIVNKVIGVPGSPPVEIDITLQSGTSTSSTFPRRLTHGLVRTGEPALFRRGDANADNSVDISDAVFILGFLFLGKPTTIDCQRSADLDDSGELDLSDATYLLNFLLLGAQTPPAPGPFECGPDPTEDGLGCDVLACQ